MPSPNETDEEMAERLQREFDLAPVATSVSVPCDSNTVAVDQATVAVLPPGTTISSPMAHASSEATVAVLPPGTTSSSMAHASRSSEPSNAVLEATVAEPEHVGITIAAIPVPSHPQLISIENVDQTALAFSLARAVRIFSVIEMVMLIFLCMVVYSPIAICMVWGPYMGYFSAKEYSVKKASIFLLYYYLKLLFDCMALFSSVRSSISLIGLLVDIFIIGTISRFVRVLRVLTEDEKASLRGIQAMQGSRSLC